MKIKIDKKAASEQEKIMAITGCNVKIIGEGHKWKINERRPLDDSFPDGYLESDRDFVLNNIEAAICLLEKELKVK